MTISLNQFEPGQAIDGMYVYMANLPQLHNVIISGSQTDPLSAGAFVTFDTSSDNVNAPIVLQADTTDKVFGVVTYNPVKNEFYGGEKVAIARENDIIWKTADGTITAGDDVYLTADNKVTATGSAGDTKVGVAITPALNDGDLLQVELHFVSAISAAQLPDLSGTYVAVTQLGVADGVATLDNTGKVPADQLPA